jgi:hypothetical protein
VFEFVGNVEASKSVPVRPVAGIIERPFTEAPRTAGQCSSHRHPDVLCPTGSGPGPAADAEARYAMWSSPPVDLLRDHAIARQEYDNAEAEAKRANAAVADARRGSGRPLNDTVVRADLRAGRPASRLRPRPRHR